MLSSDKKQCLATGEEPLSLLCLGDDVLRYLLMLDCMGRRELSNLRRTCKGLLEIAALMYDEDLCVWLTFDGTTIFGPHSRSTSIDLRQIYTHKPVVTRILNHAFEHSVLINLNLPDSVKYIGDYAFRKSKLRLLDLSASLVTHIGRGAFFDSHLTFLSLPDSVKYMGTCAFYSSILRRVYFPYSVTHIGGSAFFNSHLILLDLPDSVTYIGNHAFHNSPLTTLKLPDSVEYLGDGAFYLSKLTTINKPSSRKYIGRNICKGRTSVDYLVD